jgi:dynein heavy chain
VVPKVSGQCSGPPKKKLFLTDGWQVPLSGICIYMFRLNTGKQLPEEGFHKVWQSVKSLKNRKQITVFL